MHMCRIESERMKLSVLTMCPSVMDHRKLLSSFYILVVCGFPKMSDYLQNFEKIQYVFEGQTWSQKL
jgi:hypothetical protein